MAEQNPQDLTNNYQPYIGMGDLPEPPWLKLLKESQAMPTGVGFYGEQQLTPNEQRMAGSPDLKSESSRLAVNEKLLGTLGEKTKPVLGALTPILNILDTPRALVYSAGHELADAAGSGDASWQDFLKQAKEHKGFGDTEVLKYNKNDSTAQRIGKAFGAFAGDVLSDPLTYLTFGAGPIGKKAAAEAVSLAVKKIADENVVKAGVEASKFGADAGEAYLRNRSRGVRNYLKEQLGEEEGQKAFENLPDYARGGMGVQIPFSKYRFGNVNAGGSLTDAIKFGDESLGSLIAPLHQNFLTAMTAIGGKTGLSTAAAKLGGQSGADFKAVMQDLNSKNLSRFTFEDYLKSKKIRNAAINFKSEIINTGADAVVDALKAKEVDPDLYQKASTLFINPAKLKSYLTDPETVNNPEVQLANKLYSAFNDIVSQAEREGVPFDTVDEYMTFRLVKRELDKRKREKKVTRAQYNSSIAGFNPTKNRITFLTDSVNPITGEVLVDELGNPLKRPMYPDEINAQLKAQGLPEIAETDPINILSEYFTAMGNILPKKKLITDFIEAGLLKSGQDLRYNFNANELARFGERLIRGMTYEDLQNYGAKFGFDPRLITKEMYDVIDSPIKLNEFFETLDPNNLADHFKIGNLLQVLIRNEAHLAQNKVWESAFLTEGEFPNDVIEQARRNIDYLKSISEENSIVDSDNILREKGYVQFGQEGGVKVPDYLINVFGPEHLIDSLENMFSLNPKSPHNAAFRDSAATGLKEFMRFWRTGATVGRLTGYVFRNGLGMLWQNAVGGIRAGDYIASGMIARTDLAASIVVSTLERAKGSELLRHLDDLKSQLPKELSDRLYAEAKTYGFVLPSGMAEVKQELLRNRLTKHRTIDGKGTYYDIYKTAEKAGIYDPNKILGVYEGESLEETTRSIINNKLKANVAPEKFNEDLNKTEKLANAVLNFGPSFVTKTGRKITLKPTQLTIALNTRLEQFGRGAAIAAGLRRYGYDATGEELANMLMKAIHFDYQDLSPFEQRVMRNILPFYSWIKNNIAMEFRAMMFNPGLVNNMMRGWEDFKEIAADESGNIYLIPSWVTERYGFVTKFKYGNYPLTLSLESPLMDVNKFFNQPQGMNPLNVIDYAEFATGMNPLIKEPVQFWSQKNLFTGAPYSPQGVTPPAYLKFLDEVTGNKILQYDKEGNRTVNQKYLDVINETLPQMGLLARLAPGVFGTENQKQRLVSNYLSGILGLPVATLTESQEVGEGRSRNIALENRLAQAAGARGLDYQKLRQYAYLPQDRLKELVDRGFFDLAPKA